MNEEPQNQLAVHKPMDLSTWEDMQKMAKEIADSKMLGVANPSQAMVLFALCSAEGITPIAAIRRFHIIDGKPSMRADAMMADFLKHGGKVIWHARSDELAGATFLYPAPDDKAEIDIAATRGGDRFELLWDLEFEEESAKRAVIIKKLAKLSRDGEQTIVRTIDDAFKKGIAGTDDKPKANWARHPREMLTARVSTEGIRLVAPMLIAGVMEVNEARDVADTERHEKQLTAAAAYDPKSRDREAMQAILEEHLRNASEATTEKGRQHSLGLAAEMRTRIADLDTKPHIVIDSPEVLAPEPKKEKDDDQIPGLEVEQDWKTYELKHTKQVQGKLGDLHADTIKALYEKRGLPYVDHPKYGEEAKWITKAYVATFPAET
jgi:hypothetical protein